MLYEFGVAGTVIIDFGKACSALSIIPKSDNSIVLVLKDLFHAMNTSGDPISPMSFVRTFSKGPLNASQQVFGLFT